MRNYITKTNSRYGDYNVYFCSFVASRKDLILFFLLVLLLLSFVFIFLTLHYFSGRRQSVRGKQLFRLVIESIELRHYYWFNVKLKCR